MEKYWEAVRRNIIPTSTTQQLESLKNLLNHFCNSDIAFKSAKVSNETLNYIEVVRRNTSNPRPLEKNALIAKNESPVESQKPKKTLLLMHGFGSGLGFFFNNYDDLATSFDRVIAVDWLGMGGSSRESSSICSKPAPRYSVFDQVWARAMTDSSQRLPSTVAATDFFVDSLEEMRVQMISEGSMGKKESLHLAGHSLGGYLAAQYALKYPKNIDSLILISPVGFPQQPSKDTWAKSDQISWGTYTASTAWLANITPQTIVRMAGPKGPSMVKAVLNGRFGGRWSPLELDLISSYLYHISAAPALGEYSLNSLLEVVITTDAPISGTSPAVRPNGFTKLKPISADVTENTKDTNNTTKSDIKPVKKTSTFIYAREPLVDRLHELPKALPVLVLFGDTDWLYNPIDIINRDIRYLKTGKRILPSRADEIITETSEKPFSGIDITMQVIPQAGHHIYLDNAKGFTYSITSWLKLKGLLY